jgi:hypothetical protein
MAQELRGQLKYCNNDSGPDASEFFVDGLSLHSENLDFHSSEPIKFFEASYKYADFVLSANVRRRIFNKLLDYWTSSVQS